MKWFYIFLRWLETSICFPFKLFTLANELVGNRHLLPLKLFALAKKLNKRLNVAFFKSKTLGDSKCVIICQVF